MMPPPMTTTRAVSVMTQGRPEARSSSLGPRASAPAARAGSGAPLTEVGRDRGGLALAEPDRDPELLEVLIENLPAELDPMSREERAHLLLPLGANERT